MVTKRRSGEAGHRRKFLAIIDETPECERAVVYAARRAVNTGGGLILLFVIKPGDFQHWLGVEQTIREEALELAEKELAKHAAVAREHCETEAETVVREGRATEQIHALIEEDQDIAILVLATSPGKEGPGPLVSAIAGRDAPFPIPVTIIPAGLTDEDIESLS